MNDATLLTDGARPVVRFERHLSSPPDVVWRAVTDRAELNEWFPTDVIVARWAVGEPISFPFRDGEGPTLTGEVLEVDPPRRLSFSWGEEVLGLTLSAEGAGTLLVFTDELPPGIVARNAAGWDVCLDGLAGLTTGPDAWKPRFEHYKALAEPLLGPQEGPPSA